MRYLQIIVLFSLLLHASSKDEIKKLAKLHDDEVVLKKDTFKLIQKSNIISIEQIKTLRELELEIQRELILK